MNWQERAECARKSGPEGVTLYSPENWFSAPTDKVGIKYAKSICARCPVVDECLRYAMADEGTSSRSNRFGIFGGLTEAERESLWRTTSRRVRREMAVAS